MEPNASGFQAEKNNGFKGTTLISPIGATPRPPIKGNHLSPASQLTKTKTNGLHQGRQSVNHCYPYTAYSYRPYDVTHVSYINSS